jgi:hypothetical protein
MTTAWKSRYARETEHSELALMGFLQKALRLTDEERVTFEELLSDYVADQAKHYASQALDQEFNRGDYR